MKKVIALTSLVSLFAIGAANAGGYVSGYAVTSSGNGNSIGDVMTLNAAIGYAFENNMRIELDVFSTNLWDGDDLTDINAAFSVTSGYLKGFYDFKGDSKFTPYVGLGIGNISVGYIDYDDDISANNNKRYSISGSAILGIQYAISNKISLDLQYSHNYSRSWSKTEYKVIDSSTAESSSNSSTYKLGVMYKF